MQRYMFDQIVALANQHPNAEAAAIQLQNKLYSATELYLEYAVPFELWESQLAIIDMSGHQSMELVREVINNLPLLNCLFIGFWGGHLYLDDLFRTKVNS